MTSYSTDVREIRKFGFIALIFFGCLCALGLWMKKPIPTYLFGFIALLGIGFIAIPASSKPIYTAWMKFAHFVGKIVTTVVLALAYYLVITPSAVIKRLFGGTPIPIKQNKRASSYWVTRSEPAQPKERFSKRY